MTRLALNRAPFGGRLATMPEEDLILLRAGLDVEMRRRKIAFSVGQVGESLTIKYFKVTPGRPKLQSAPAGTKNVDALSRGGDRYSIKTICNARKTGTIYPDREEREKQLFEFLLIVKLAENWSLQSIHQLSWPEFVRVRSWDKRMNAWYVAASARTLGAATLIFKASQPPDA